ncbi:MAG: hypothetical protein QM500_21320 [Methylococcales bacterium]
MFLKINLTKYLIVIASVIFIQSCADKSAPQISNFPMLTPSDESRGKGPWQVVTSKGIPITYYEKRVYLDAGSSFILSDGTPIRTINGKRIYWNNQGLIITKKRKVIMKQDIFELDKKVPLDNNHSITLKGY